MDKKFAKRLLAFVLAVSMVNFFPTAMTVQAEETTTESTVIDVTDFGADPSGKNDSTEAVMAALEEAKTIEGSKTLSFPYGEYRFDEDHSTTRVYHTSNTSSRSYPEKKIAILLEEADDLTIEGNGSTLLVYGDIMALAVVESSNIKIQNLVLDYKDADTIDISVVKTGEDENGNPYADIFVPAAYNYVIFEDAEGGKHIQWQGDISAETGKPYWTWDDADFCAYLVVYKGYDRTVIRANDKAASNPFTGVTNITPSGDATVRFTYESKLPTDIVEGNIYQLSNSAWRQTAGAFFWESEGLTVENIDVHYLSGFGWLTQMCMDVEFKGVDFLPRDGSGKYTTSNADQLHVAGCGGYFKVTDCNFSMAHDDPINVHGTYMRVEEVIDARTVRLKYIHGQQGGFRQFHEGDEVLFYSRTYLEAPDGQVEDQPFIVESSVGPGEAYTGPAEAYDGTTLDLVTEIVTFKEDLPAETIADLQKTIVKNNEEQALYVAENVTYTPTVTIRGNRMKSIPTRGILCTTRQEVVIEDNIFDNMAMASIYLSNDADDWYESGPIRNLTIRNNVFYIRPTGQGAVGTVSGVFIEPITIGAWAMTGGETQPKNPDALVHENITITGNTFYISNDNVVTANRVDGLTITNNTIIHDDDIAIAISTKGELGVGESQDIAVDVTEKILEKDVFQFNDCTNVTVSGNTYDEGMNLNVEMSNMDAAADLTLGEGDAAVLTVNQGENKVSSASQVQLISSHPDVAYVDEYGKLVGVSAGTTTIQAYIEKNGALIRSNEVTVAVGDGLAAGLALTADDTFFENENDRAALNTQGTEVTCQVLDPVTGETSNKAIVTENTYIAKKDGAVIVKATAANGDTAKLLMINSFGVSYDEGREAAEGVEVLNPTDGGTVFTDKSVTIHSASNGNAMAENGSGLKTDNIVGITIPEEMQGDLRIRVKASGLTPHPNGYGSSGVMLYTAEDNYFFVGKRGHFAGITTMTEVAGQFSEAGTTSDTETTVTFGFVIEENDTENVIVNYQVDGAEEWSYLGEYSISHLRGEGKDIKLGLVSWLNSETTTYDPTFSDILMAKNSDVLVNDINAVEAMVLTSGDALAEGVEVLNETAENGGAASFTETSVTITSAGNGNALAEDGTGKTADNIVSIAIPDEMQSDLKLRVKASGLTPYGNGYGSSGVMLFTGLDNYFFAGRRAHYSGIATMYENAADFTENNATNTHTETTVTFEFIITANDADHVIVNYLLDGATEWENLGTYDISYLRGDGKRIKLGLVSWLNSETTAYNPTFSEIQLSQYSGGSTVDMRAVSAMTLSKAVGPNVENPTENGTVPVWKDGVQIVPQANGNGMTPGGSLVNNVVNLEIPEEMETDLRLLVDAEGLVKKAGGWSSSGVMLYTDFDNYLFAGKRNHFEGIATMTENAGSFTEGSGDSRANDLTATTFEFVISGTTATVSYLDADGNWQKEDEFEIAHLQNGNMKLGLVSWLNGGDSFTPVYSNIRMATADVSRDDLLAQDPVSLYGAIANARPVVGAVTIREDTVTAGTTVTVNVSAEDADGSISSYLYQWNLETANGTETTYTTVGEYTPNAEGKLTVGVIVFDNYHKPSELKRSAEKEVTATLNTGNELSSLYVNGNKVEGLAGGTGVAYVPAGTEKIRISYDKADSGVATTINATTIIAEGSNSAVVALEDVYTITRGDVTYTLRVYAVESNDNALKAITVGTQSVDLADEIKAGTDSYFVQVEKDTDTLPLVIESAEGSTIKVTRSYFEKEVADVDTNRVEAEIAMTAGINAYYIYVTAADGVSTREVKLYLYADGYADCDLTEIKVNGAAIEGFDPATEAYTIHITAEQAENMEIEVSSKDGQQTSITYAGSRTEGNEAAFALTENLNEIIIANVAKNMWSKRFYTLNVIVDRDDNADLLTLTTDTGFGAAFEPDTNAYVLALNTDGTIAVTATAQMTEANIRMYVGDELQAVEAKGALTGEFTLYEGENRISVVVTAPDGTTVNTYTLDVPAKGCVYASDVIAAGTKEGITSTTVEVGYGSVNLDGNVGGSGKIALPDESGNRVVFDKGIGAHASSEIVFNLEEGHEFTAFEAYAGIDYVQYNTNQSSVNFQVWVDGELKWESGETGAQTPMQFVSVDVVGASEVKLVIDDLDWNGYDHSEWADACFIRSFEKAPDTPDVPAENVARNTATSAEYATVKEALEAAEAGQTIILLVDHTEDIIAVLPGVTLDLNGYELTASYVVGFDTAHIVDSVGDGRLVTGVENVVLDEENAMAAIYDGEGYLFTKIGFAIRQDTGYTGEGLRINAMAYPVDMNVVKLLQDGSADENIQIVILLSWDANDGTGYQAFTFTDAVVGNVYSSNDGTWSGYGKMFSMTITGYEDITGLRARIMVLSGTNAAYTSTNAVSLS